MKKKHFIKVLTLLILVFLPNIVKVEAQENKVPEELSVTSQLNKEQLVSAKAHLSALLKSNIGYIKLIAGNDNYTSVTNLGYPKEILLFDNHLEFIFKDDKNVTTRTTKLYFSYILEDKIKTTVVNSNYDNGSLNSEIHLRLGNISLAMPVGNAVAMKSLANDLAIIQDKFNEERFKMDQFEKMAKTYHTLKEKPSITEEQRKLIVQANTFAQIGYYDKAIEHYVQVFEINQTSYPEAYFNLALLLGQMNRYRAAISFMKKHLLLAPNSTDEKKANNKIKDWEIRINN